MEKPDWCPHPECILKVQSQDMMCLGKLLEPSPHNNDFNTHRLCLDTRETDDCVFDLRLNWSDAWNMMRLLKIVKDE